MGSIAGFKIPTPWDQNRPKFDGENVNSLRLFLRNCETIFTSGGITNDQEKKDKLLEYLDNVDIREQWQELSKYSIPATFNQWKEHILQLYPEIEDMASGSLQKLVVICSSNRPITRTELGKLRRFTIAFTNEAEKLLKGTALVVNLTPVDMILGVLDVPFATELENAMNQAAIASIMNPAIQAGQNGLTLADRRGDRLPYKQVLAMADLIADNWVGPSAKSLLGGNSRLDSTIGISVGSHPLVSNEAVKIKSEISDRIESFAGELAKFKDSSDLQERRIGESIKRMENSFENSLKQLNQSLRDRPPHMDRSVAVQQQHSDNHNDYNHGNNNSSQGNRERGPCYFCNGPHLINECVTKDEFIDRGWIMVQGGLVKLGNGNWIPRHPENLSRQQKVEDHYRKLGITRDSSNTRSANYVHSFYSEGSSGSSQPYDPYEHDRVDHLYDTIDDEIWSAKVQQMTRIRGSNQGYIPQLSQNYSIPAAAGPSYNMGPTPVHAPA